jgi:hypothetical protein
MKHYHRLSLFFAMCLVSLAALGQAPEKPGDYKAPKTKKPIVIDGKGNEKAWSKATWKNIEHTWLGTPPTPEDFQGRYKMVWDEDHLYFLVEIQDDSLSDQRPDPFDLWWEDDCLELFIDEDNSDGEHQFNHNAFAYHITLDLDVVDMGVDKGPILLNDHLSVKWVRTGKTTYVWEVAMKVFSDKFDEKSKNNQPVKLYLGKKLGFAVSYNDNDGNFERENFIGSVPVEGEDKNRGWIDAGIFGTVELVK